MPTQTFTKSICRFCVLGSPEVVHLLQDFTFFCVLEDILQVPWIGDLHIGEIQLPPSELMDFLLAQTLSSWWLT